MDIHPVVKRSLQEISFPVRYKSLSDRFSYHGQSLHQYSNEIVLQIANDLGVNLKFLKSDNFFKASERKNGLDFNLNISLKYGSAELILGIKSVDQKIVDGGPFGVLYRQVLNGDERIKLPSFRDYEDLREILKEAFSIYEDFQREIMVRHHA